MNEHDNVITAAMLLANIKNAVDDNDDEFLAELAERADDPYTSMLLEYCDALADAFIENATLSESAGDDDILLAEDMKELLEIFGLKTADKNHLMNYDDAVSRNAKYKKNIKEYDPVIAGIADHREEEKSRKATGDEYDAVMKNNRLANALRRRSLLFGPKTDEERQKSVNADIQKNHLKAAAHRARMTRMGADFNYLKDRFGKNGAYRTSIRDTKAAVKKDLAAAKYAYKSAKGDERYRLKMQYKDLKAQNGGLWRNRAMRRQMKADLNAHRLDVKRNTGVIAFKNQRTGKQDYAVANLRAAKDQITGNTSAQPSVKTYGGDGKYAGLNNANLASTMNVGKSKNLDTINNKLPNSVNPDSPMNSKPQTGDETPKNLTESYDFYAYALLESNGWVPSEDNKDTLMSEGALVLAGYDALLEGTDGFILAELLDLNGFEVTENNINVLAEALDSGSAMIDFEKKNAE